MARIEDLRKQWEGALILMTGDLFDRFVWASSGEEVRACSGTNLSISIQLLSSIFCSQAEKGPGDTNHAGTINMAPEWKWNSLGTGMESFLSEAWALNDHLGVERLKVMPGDRRKGWPVCMRSQLPISPDVTRKGSQDRWVSLGRYTGSITIIQPPLQIRLFGI